MRNIRNKKIRVPSTTVELVQILGAVLRDHTKIKQWDAECWTFEHVADWDIERTEYMLPSQANGDDSFPIQDYEYKVVEHHQTIYLGSGKCHAFGYGKDPGNAKELELRVRCEYDDWIPTGQKLWDIEVWIKLPDGSIARHHYICFLGYGQDRDIMLKENSKMRKHPPNRIAFWRKDEVKTPSRPAYKNPRQELVFRVVEKALQGSRQVKITLKRESAHKINNLRFMLLEKTISMRVEDWDRVAKAAICPALFDWLVGANRTTTLTLNKVFDEEWFAEEMHDGIEKIEVVK